MSLAEQAVQQLDRLSAIILDDVGDGPTPSDLAAAARGARDAVAQLAVPALTQLTGLIAGVADSLVTGATEWNTSLGGTLMAAVDDVRHLAARPFTDEDNEHLAHRASELKSYVRAPASGMESAPPSAPASAPSNPAGMESAPPSAPASAPSNPAPIPAPTAASTPSPAPIPGPAASPIVPISDLFYADNGPHIVSGGTPTEAVTRSDLLGRGIDALDNLTMKPIAKPVTFGAVEVVPVETLLYRGRAALERAAAIREQIKASGVAPSPATLDEMYDLIGLALKD
jgi:hypothetical protein